MNRTVGLAFAVALAGAPALAEEPDGLILPQGFHAQVVADGLTGARHVAVRDNGDIFVSTNHGRDQPSIGIYALRIGPDRKAVQTEKFSTIDQGTGIRIYKGALYVASATAVNRIALSDTLVPAAAPEVIVDGLAATGHGLAFDGRGNLYVSSSGGGGTANCPDTNTPQGAKPVGLKPCPLLATRGGVWRFDDGKPGQKQADGEHWATGIRNTVALDWRNGDTLYSAMHGRDGTSKGWPEFVSDAEDDAIADELSRLPKGADMGWPYTYWDGAKSKRLVAPEYGGDGKKEPTEGSYAVPVAAFQPSRPAVLDLTFYNGRQFPGSYRGGAFIAMHGGGSDGTVLPGGHGGYNITFVPFTGNGRAGKPVAFADGFAGPSPGDRNVKTAKYRPVGITVGPDGSLYVVESQKGRLWRIYYGNNP